MKPSIQPIRLPDSNNHFHPSITLQPDGSWLLSVQSIIGPDHYGNPCFSRSKDGGKTWEKFSPVVPFTERNIGDSLQEGVADVRPFCFGNIPDVFFFGCTSIYCPKGNAYYFQSELKKPVPQTRAVCAVLHPDGSWSDQELKLPIKTRDCRTTCIQPVFCPPDKVLLPFHFDTETIVYEDRPTFRASVATALFRIRNGTLEFIEMSNILKLAVERGLLEPSLIRLADGRIALTIRAEDGHGYMSVSADGLHWDGIRPWCWEDGTPLEMTSTQQHWVRLGDKVFLAYTRNNGTNTHIMRCRAPMYLAEADPEHGFLLRDTEQIVFPRQQRNGIEALYGNFHASRLDEHRALITDAALFTGKNYKMETTLMGAIVSD